MANSDLAYREHFAVGRMFARIGWEADRLLDTARQLLREARHLEPYDDWYKALRLYDPDIWEALRGDTLVALDRRIASELLLRFHDDLIITGLIPQGVPPGRMDEPHRERLKTDRSELDEVLMDVGLSPHPSLVLALEGETEMIIVPRLMRLLGVKDAPDFIRLFQYGGVEQSFHLLVRYVVAPALGDRLGDPAGDLYPFTRPPAKIMVTADPEGRQLRTEDDRASWRGGAYERSSKSCHATCGGPTPSSGILKNTSRSMRGTNRSSSPTSRRTSWRPPFVCPSRTYTGCAPQSGDLNCSISGGGYAPPASRCRPRARPLKRCSRKNAFGPCWSAVLPPHTRRDATSSEKLPW